MNTTTTASPEESNGFQIALIILAGMGAATGLGILLSMIAIYWKKKRIADALAREEKQVTFDPPRMAPVAAPFHPAMAPVAQRRDEKDECIMVPVVPQQAASQVKTETDKETDSGLANE